MPTRRYESGRRGFASGYTMSWTRSPDGIYHITASCRWMGGRVETYTYDAKRLPLTAGGAWRQGQRQHRREQKESDQFFEELARKNEETRRRKEGEKKEAERNAFGEVSGYDADETGVRFVVQDWTLGRVIDVDVPRDQASPELLTHLGKLHDGAVVKVRLPEEPGADIQFWHVWNRDGSPGPDNHGSPKMAPSYPSRGYFAYQMFLKRIEYEKQFEKAKQTGHLRLTDGKADAWHGVTPSGQECHHRHRTPQAATECVRRFQRAGSA